MYSVDVLLPTARFAFWVDGGRVEVLPEHRSPEGYLVYEKLAAERRVVGMTTFPNTVLLRGPKTILVDPGIHLQNQPVVKALAAPGLGVDDLDFIALTPAHLDHAGACADVPGPVVVHELELDDPDRPMVAGLLPRER
ncbi:MAG: MBL fold metallo-hydrolase, partial [Thermoleophilia bacterium]